MTATTATNADDGKPILICHSQQANEMAEERNNHLQITNANGPFSLAPEDWEVWDEEILTESKAKLSLFKDLAPRCQVSVDIGDTDYVWFTTEGDYHAEHTADFEPEVKASASEINRYSQFIPIIRSAFGIGYRQSKKFRTGMGGQLAAEQRAQSIDTVLEAMEDMCLYGPMLGNSRIGQGLLNYSGSNLVTKTDGALNGASGDHWRQCVYEGLDALRADRMLNPRKPKVKPTMYVNDGDWLYATSAPYDTSGGMGATSIGTFIKGMQPDIVEVPTLPAGTLLFVTKDRSTVAIPYALAPAARPLPRLDIRDPYRFIVESVVSIVPKQSHSGQCGICRVVTSGSGNRR